MNNEPLPPLEELVRLPGRVVRCVRARTAGDSGISLIEVVMALMIIAVVMTSAAGFFLNSLKTTGGAAGRQTAVNVASQQLENIRAVPGTSLLTGRTQAEVQSLLAWSGAVALTSHDDTLGTGGVLNYDPQAAAPGGESVQTVTTQTLNNQKFTLHNFIDPCWLPVGTAPDATTQGLACDKYPNPVPANSKVTDLFRVTVAASWVGGAATGCTNGCTYSASSLVDPHHDPTYQSNITHPTITGSTPSSIAVGATKTLTVHGDGFQGGATAATCGNATVVSVDQQSITNTTLNVTIMAGSTSGACSLQITNPDGGNTGTGWTFNIDVLPTITSISSVQNYTTQKITITGTNYASPQVSTASGQLNGTAYQDTTGITGMYTASAPFVGASGTVPVTVQNPDGGSATGNITVTQSKPTVGINSSTSVNAGQTLQGSLPVGDLAPSNVKATVTRGSVTITGISSGYLGVSYTAPSTAGSDTLTITNPDGGTATYSYTVVQPIASVSANCTGQEFSYNGYHCSGSTKFTVNGSGFGSSPNVQLSVDGGKNYYQLSATGGATSFTFTVQVYVNGQPYGLDPGAPFTVQVMVNGQPAYKSGQAS